MNDKRKDHGAVDKPLSQQQFCKDGDYLCYVKNLKP